MDIKEVTDTIDSYCDEVAKDISELKIMDVSDIKRKLSIRLRFILTDITANLQSKMQLRYDEIKEQLARKDLSFFQLTKIQNTLRDMKPELTKANAIHNRMLSVNRYTVLSRYIEDKHPDIFSQFLKDHDEFKESIIKDIEIKTIKHQQYQQTPEAKEYQNKMGSQSVNHRFTPISHKDEKYKNGKVIKP